MQTYTHIHIQLHTYAYTYTHAYTDRLVCTHAQKKKKQWVALRSTKPSISGKAGSNHARQPIFPREKSAVNRINTT